MPKKQALFRKCPSCGFAKCWAKAPRCEECNFDFKLGRKPRKTKIEFDEDEAPPVKVEEKPAETHKTCPNCKTQCWYRAPFCEKCAYNFKTGETHQQQEERERKEAGEKAQQNFSHQEKRIFLGYRPIFSEMKREPWMDDYMPGEGDEALRRWAHIFLRKLRDHFGTSSIYSGCVVEWAESFTKNKHLKESALKLHSWFGMEKGVSQWHAVRFNEFIMKKGEMLTESESNAVYREWTDMMQTHIAVERLYGKFRGFEMMLPDETEDLCKSGRYAHLGSGQGKGVMWLLPDDWHDMNDKKQQEWMVGKGILMSPLPAKRRKLPEQKKRSHAS